MGHFFLGFLGAFIIYIYTHMMQRAWWYNTGDEKIRRPLYEEDIHIQRVLIFRPLGVWLDVYIFLNISQRISLECRVNIGA